MEVERHPEVFTNAPVTVIVDEARVEEMRTTEPPVKALVQMDGEQHKANRAIVNDWFKPGSVKQLQARIDELATHYVDQMASFGGRCDFAQDVAVHYPLQVILAILGLPESDYARMLQLTQELFGAEDPDMGRVAEDESQMNVLLDFATYFSALGRRPPGVAVGRPRVGDRQRRDRRGAAVRPGAGRPLRDHRHRRPRHHVELDRRRSDRPHRAARPARAAPSASPS